MKEDFEKVKEIIEEVMRIAGSGEVISDKAIQNFYNKGNESLLHGINSWMQENRKERDRREKED